MINSTDNRPNYRQAVTCLNCEHVVDANARGHAVALECTKHDNWYCETPFVCDDHPMLKPVEKADPNDIEVIDMDKLELAIEESQKVNPVAFGEVAPVVQSISDDGKTMFDGAYTGFVKEKADVTVEVKKSKADGTQKEKRPEKEEEARCEDKKTDSFDGEKQERII